VQRATIDAVGTVDFDSEDAGRAAAAASENSQWHVEDIIADDEDKKDFDGVAETAPPAGASEETANASITEHETDTDIDADDPAGAKPFRERDHPRNYVIVHAALYTTVGAIACVLLTLALVMFVANATAAWCEVEMSAFRDVMLCAALFDVFGAQPLIIALTFVWRWLQIEVDAVDDDDEPNGGRRADFDDEYDASTGDSNAKPGCGRGEMVHELHPIDGQWRLVGPPPDLMDDA